MQILIFRRVNDRDDGYAANLGQLEIPNVQSKLVIVYVIL